MHRWYLGIAPLMLSWQEKFWNISFKFEPAAEWSRGTVETQIMKITVSDFAYLTSSQVTLMLLVQGPHLENQCFLPGQRKNVLGFPRCFEMNEGSNRFMSNRGSQGSSQLQICTELLECAKHYARHWEKPDEGNRQQSIVLREVRLELRSAEWMGVSQQSALGTNFPPLGKGDWVTLQSQAGWASPGRLSWKNQCTQACTRAHTRAHVCMHTPQNMHRTEKIDGNDPLGKPRPKVVSLFPSKEIDIDMISPNLSRSLEWKAGGETLQINSYLCVCHETPA